MALSRRIPFGVFPSAGSLTMKPPTGSGVDASIPLTLSASRDIPFNKLVLSQSNVRRIKAGVSIEELADWAGGPLADPGVWRGALLWAIALYVPLSAPLSKLETSLENSPLPESLRQSTLVISSLLLALVTGVVTQLGLSWALGPGWASSLGVVAVGWSVLLILANAGKAD